MAALFRSLGLCAGLAALLGCSPQSQTATLSCEHIVIETPSGPLTGIEDMATIGSDHVLLSAYNRRDPENSPAGVYKVRVDTNASSWQAIPALTLPQGALPHGFAVAAEKGRLAVILRYRDGPPKLALFQAQDTAYIFKRWLTQPNTWKATTAYPCNMNDAAFTPDGRIVVSNDRAACSGFAKSMETLLGRSKGSVFALPLDDDDAPDVLLEDLYFPNGVAIDDTGAAYAALTRAKAILNTETRARWTLNSAPDNLFFDTSTQQLWAAAIPSLPAYAAYRAGLYPGTLASHIIRLSPNSGTLQEYKTKAFSGATAVVTVGDHLILSGAFSDGVAICQTPNA